LESICNWSSAGRPSCLLRRLDIRRQRFRGTGKIVAEVKRLDVDRPHRAVPATVAQVSARQLGGLAVLLRGIVLARGGGEKLALLAVRYGG
jgi:hypothetical protein